MDLVYLALDVLETHANLLKKKRRKGERISFKDVKPLLKALGALAEDKDVLAEARKKSIWYFTALKMYSGAMKGL